MPSASLSGSNGALDRGFALAGPSSTSGRFQHCVGEEGGMGNWGLQNKTGEQLAPSFSRRLKINSRYQPGLFVGAAIPRPPLDLSFREMGLLCQREPEPAHPAWERWQAHVRKHGHPAVRDFVEPRHDPRVDAKGEHAWKPAKQKRDGSTHEGSGWQFVTGEGALQAARMSNNALEALDGLPAFLGLYMAPETYKSLNWLDVSFNRLTSLDLIVESCPQLSVLYAQANDVRKLPNRLIELQHLTKLILKNNPCVERAGTKYRAAVLTMLPGLKNLDFSPLTSGERNVVRKKLGKGKYAAKDSGTGNR